MRHIPNAPIYVVVQWYFSMVEGGDTAACHDAESSVVAVCYSWHVCGCIDGKEQYLLHSLTVNDELLKN